MGLGGKNGSFSSGDKRCFGGSLLFCRAHRRRGCLVRELRTGKNPENSLTIALQTEKSGPLTGTDRFQKVRKSEFALIKGRRGILDVLLHVAKIHRPVWHDG